MKSKRGFLISFFLLLCFSVFAYEGNLQGEKNLKVLQSTWFDIIYPESCEESAAVLYENADGIYEKLVDSYKIENPPCRLPIVLTSKTELFNAYYTSYTYNHILMFVTAPIDDLENQKDTLLDTFKHELTHAFTHNIKSPFFKGVGKVFGDFITFAPLTVTPGMAEGAAVASESVDGHGRLNDEFTRQPVKQAKIEGKFPAFSDIQGSRDIYPAGSYYHFNGAFHEYLQKTYGMEKYAKWWYNCVNSSLFISLAFKNAYNGLSLSKAWKDFQQSYEVPQIPADPVAAGLAKDLFNSSATKSTIQNKSASQPAGLSYSQKGLTYIDEYNKTVYFVSNQNLESGKAKPKKLFQLNYVENAIQSEDGKYIAVSYYDAKASVYQYHVAVYNTESKKWTYFKENGVKDASIIQNENDYYLVCHKFSAENNQIVISKLTENGGKVKKSDDEAVYINFARKQLPNVCADVGGGRFAFILKNEMNFSIQVCDLKGNFVKNFPISENDKKFNYETMIVHYLSHNLQNKDEVYFSWCAKGTMPRAGKLNLKNGSITLSDADLSGGVYYPVVCESGDIIYGGKFFESNRLFRGNSLFEKSKTVASGATLPSSSTKNVSGGAVDSKKSVQNLHLDEAVKYNPFKFAYKGLLLPFSQMTSTSYDSKNRTSYMMPLGVTYSVKNPWDANLFTISAGYGTQTNSYGFSLDYTGGTATSTFTYALHAMSEFDPVGWKAAETSVTTNFTKSLGHFSAFGAAPQIYGHVGRSNNKNLAPESGKISEYFGGHQSVDPTLFAYGRASMHLIFSSVRKVGDSRNSKAGIKVGVVPYYNISYNITDNVKDYDGVDMSVYSVLYIPRLLPISCPSNISYNLPVKIVANAFSTSLVRSSLIGLSSYPDLAYVGAEMVLLNWEIQKAMPIFTIFYISNLQLSLTGCAGYNYQDSTNPRPFYMANEEFNAITSGQNKLIGLASVKLLGGFSYLNVGSFANSSAKLYASISADFYFKDGNVEPKFGFNIEQRF
jgi:hypothetical protein